MSTQPFLAIVNPAAGSGRCGRLAADALSALRERGLSIDVRHTSGPGDARRLACAAAEQGRRRFIAVGGDGTAYELLNGLTALLGQTQAELRPSLGFLPLGTGNSFLRDFGAGDLDHALSALTGGRARACDVMRLSHADGSLHYMNLLSLGFVADVCALANRRFKALGAGGYGLGVLAALAGLRSRPLHMRVDAGPDWAQPAVFLSVCNSRFTGGSMMMAPYADTGDGLADLVVCGHMTRRTLLSVFPKIFSGHHVHHHTITAARARCVELFEPAPVDLMIDGEVVRATPNRIDVRPAALDVFV